MAEDNIILGFPVETNEDVILNYCLNVAKYYMYCSKINQKPSKLRKKYAFSNVGKNYSETYGAIYLMYCDNLVSCL